MSDDMTIKKLRELCDAATPGPWQNGLAGACNVVHFDGDDVRGVGWLPSHNAEFAIAARTALPALLDRLEAAERERDEARGIERNGWAEAERLGALERSFNADWAELRADRDTLKARLERAEQERDEARIAREPVDRSLAELEHEARDWPASARHMVLALFKEGAALQAQLAACQAERDAADRRWMDRRDQIERDTAEAIAAWLVSVDLGHPEKLSVVAKSIRDGEWRGPDEAELAEARRRG